MCSTVVGQREHVTRTCRHKPCTPFRSCSHSAPWKQPILVLPSGWTVQPLIYRSSDCMSVGVAQPWRLMSSNQPGSLLPAYSITARWQTYWHVPDAAIRCNCPCKGGTEPAALGTLLPGRVMLTEGVMIITLPHLPQNQAILASWGCQSNRPQSLNMHNQQ